MSETCRVCGDTVEAGLVEICSGCRLDTWLPCWYELAEEYAKDPIAGRFNARRRPLTLRAILDAPGPPCVSDCLAGLGQGVILHMRALEASQGLDDEDAMLQPEF